MTGTHGEAYFHAAARTATTHGQPRGGQPTTMIRSMTGFGAARAEIPGGVVTVEIRTVNHRYFKATFRLPSGFEAWEIPLTEVVREKVLRGHASTSVALELAEPSSPIALDVARAQGYLEAVRELRERFGLSGEIDLPLLASFGDLFRARAESAPDVPLEPVLRAAREAVAGVVAMREQEGRALARHLSELLARLEAECAAIEARAPERLRRERDRLRQAIRELTDGLAVDEERLTREIAYLAERWDIQEELVRFRSHLGQLRHALEQGGGEPVGKRLSFLVQELHREGNTIGAKANDAEIAERVVTLKTGIEQLREQVENVE